MVWRRQGVACKIGVTMDQQQMLSRASVLRAQKQNSPETGRTSSVIYESLKQRGKVTSIWRKGYVIFRRRSVVDFLFCRGASPFSAHPHYNSSRRQHLKSPPTALPCERCWASSCATCLAVARHALHAHARHMAWTSVAGALSLAVLCRGAPLSLPPPPPPLHSFPPPLPRPCSRVCAKVSSPPMNHSAEIRNTPSSQPPTRRPRQTPQLDVSFCSPSLRRPRLRALSSAGALPPHVLLRAASHFLITDRVNNTHSTVLLSPREWNGNEKGKEDGGGLFNTHK